ncbi:uncharacterized protein LOC108047625 [Drosophila rhopaloa]|uniref:Uncharacterized protein LOC108047625 n=1 Tax=Drosophila rhopaloa TaxID=1041015 RepID=A0A6P4F7R5_DRORH|nr:uncharacterized protein LOC108047625 [Drosophila rhopaloa]
MSKATKLRFALITEDVLDKLRPRSQSECTRSKYLDEIYTAIRTAVNEVVDEKLKELSWSIDQVVEDRMAKILSQQGQGRGTSVGQRDGKEKDSRKDNKDSRKDNKKDHKDSKKDHKDNKERDSKGAVQSVESISSLRRSTKRHRPSKKRHQSQEPLPSSPEDQLAKRSRTKAQKITVMPIHRETQVKSTPLNNLPPLSMDRNDLDEEDDDDFSDAEGSILTIAAKYLKKLEDARSRKHQHQHFH